MKALKKVRFWLYGIKFILETDANLLVAELNRFGTDLPGTLVTKWIVWIRLFDFDVRHILGNKYTAADGLSRRLSTEKDLAEAEFEEDIDNFILAQLNILCACLVFVNALTSILHKSYFDQSRKIASYLTTLQKPGGMTSKKFYSFKKQGIRFKVQDSHFFGRNSKNVPFHRVIDDPTDQLAIFIQLHNQSGHNDREGL